MVRLQQQNYKTLHTNSKIQQLGRCAALHSADNGDGNTLYTVVVAVHTSWWYVTVCTLRSCW